MESMSIAEADVSTVAELFNKLEKCLEGKDKTGTRGFLPAPVLKELVTRKTVEAILESLDEDELQQPEEETSRKGFIAKLASFVTGEDGDVGAHKIFAILAWMGKPGLIQRFYAGGLRQDVLPIFYDSDRGVVRPMEVALEQDRESEGPSGQALREKRWREVSN
jgi:hypothetical protein